MFAVSCGYSCKRWVLEVESRQTCLPTRSVLWCVYTWLWVQFIFSISRPCQENNLWWSKEKKQRRDGIQYKINVLGAFSFMCRSVLFWLLSLRWFAPRVGRRQRLSTSLHWWVGVTWEWVSRTAGYSRRREKMPLVWGDRAGHSWVGESASGAPGWPSRKSIWYLDILISRYLDILGLWVQASCWV